MKHGVSKKKKSVKKTLIVIISLVVIFALTGAGYLIYSNYFKKEPTERDFHTQVATEAAKQDEKIPIHTEAGDEPIYINAIPGMPKNSYEDSGFYTNDFGYKAYKHNGKDISTVGIDVSYVQGDIDWQAVKSSGVDFAILRCGARGYGESGIMIEDETFHKNAQEALDAGIDIGVYFFSQAITVEEAKEEADFVLDIIKDYNIKYPVAFDWEHFEEDEARTDNIDSTTLTNMARAFCDQVDKAGYTPVIYANRSLLYFEYDLAKLSDIEIWLASYEDTPNYYYDFGMWQYSKEGTINGIEGTVDLNVCMYKY